MFLILCICVYVYYGNSAIEECFGLRGRFSLGMNMIEEEVAFLSEEVSSSRC